MTDEQKHEDLNDLKMIMNDPDTFDEETRTEARTKYRKILQMQLQS